MDKSILTKLGLENKEIELYLYLVKSKVQTIKQIAATTSINRTTCYRYLDSLEKKGLVEWIVGERGRKIQTTPPENLNLYLEEQKKKLSDVAKSLPQLIATLQLSKPSDKFATQVRYYQGEKGIEQAIWNTLHATETTRSYAALRRREFIDPSFEDEFEAEWAKRGLSDKVITNEERLDYIRDQLVPAYKDTLAIRVIPAKKFYITNDIIIYNNILAIISLEKDNLVGVEIENAEIAKTQKSIFDIVWEVVKKI